MTQIVKDFARLDDPRVDDFVVNIESVPSWMDETVVAKQCQMLRQVGTWKFCDFEQFFYRSFPHFEDIKNLQSLGIGQNLVDIGVLEVGFFGKW